MLIYQQASKKHMIWVIWVTVVFNLFTFGFLGHLILFHIRLHRMGMTTY